MSTVNDGEIRLWNWVEIPLFAAQCRELSDRLGIAYEHDFDLIRWAIFENVCRNPLKAPLDPRFTSNDRRRGFRTTDAPGLTAYPPLVVFFRVVRFPQFGEQGTIEGREIWLETDLREAGYSALADADA